MKKSYKRIMIIFLIIAMVFAFVPMYKANADASNNTIDAPEDIEFESDEITYSSVTLRTYALYKNATGGYFDLEVEGDDLTEDLAGFSGTLTGFGIDFTSYKNTNKVMEEGWEVSSMNVSVDSNNPNMSYLSFTVEKKDEYISTEGNVATLRIYYTVQDIPDEYLCVGIGNVSNHTAFVTADRYNTTARPLDGLGNDSQMFLGIERMSRDMVEVLSVYNKEAVIKRNEDGINDLYIKLDGTNNGFGNLENLIKRLDLNFEFVNILNLDLSGSGDFVTIKYENNEWKVTSVSELLPENIKGKYTVDEVIELANIDTENLNSITFSGIAGDEITRIQEMGDLWNDDTANAEGKINIYDVIELRKAIIGDETVLNSEEFSIGRTDVNFSNSELDQIGDVGDVISIRQRILNRKWMDVVRYGDINLDGDVDADDALLLEKYLNEGETLNSKQLANADVDLSGDVTQDDYDFLSEYINGQISELPIMGMGGI